ncbi:hypothetical protein PENTCL1PPCAC_29911, partial [Pristionchus entomophagus]
MHFTSLDIFFICAHAISGFLGVLGNAGLLAAIRFRSPSSWKSYSVLLVNCAFIDMVACFCSSMAIERFVSFLVASSKFVTVSVYLGPCTLISGFVCHCLHCE